MSDPCTQQTTIESPLAQTVTFAPGGSSGLEAARPLLFGMLALQIGFITRAALFEAVRVWVPTKSKPLAELLCEESHLSDEQKQVLEALTSQYLQAHAGDARQSLAALPAPADVWQELYRLGDVGLRAAMETTIRPPDSAGDPCTAFSPRPGDGAWARYQILRSHACGGLGEVFVARDHELKRQVAVKEIQISKANDPVNCSRFLLEAEITGNLEHPGIVPVYGLGRHADGRPFYAMRFIEGETLRDAISRLHEADVRERAAGEANPWLRQLLSRFIAVCNTVAYAHSRGVLHRDLKPGNILLGKYAETLVVDWGLAKAMGSRPEEVLDNLESTYRPTLADPQATEPGAVFGTPPYMSPEQACGQIEQLGPASDIYSLGAILYTLLSGRCPFPGTDKHAILEKVRRGQWQPPQAIKPDVPPPLNAVCCKAMALQPEDRYATALELAVDVEHWLADEPVSAWQEPRSVRLGRWLRRHRAGVRAGVAAVGVVLLCLASATLLLMSANDSERKAKLLAERNQAKAQDRFQIAFRVVDWFTRQIGESADLKAQNLELLRQKLLTEAVTFYQNLAAEEADEQTVQVRAERGRVFVLLADLHYELGKNEDALVAAGQARDIFRRLVQDFPEDHAFQRDLARSYYTLGYLYLDENHYRESDQAWQQAAVLQESLSGTSSDPAYQHDLAQTYAEWGLSYFDRGLYTDAEKAQLQALDIRRRLADWHRPESERDVAESYTNLGSLYRVTGKYAEAQQHIQRAIEIADQLVRVDPQDAKHQFALANGYYTLGLCLYTVGHELEAEDPYRRAVTILRQLLSAHPRLVEYREALARVLDALGAVYREMGKAAEAAEAYQEALNLCEGLAAVQPRVAWYRFLGARIRQHLGIVFRETGRLKEAVDANEQALRVCIKEVHDHPDHVTFGINLGSVYATQGDLLRDLGDNAEALKCYQWAIERLVASPERRLLQVDRQEYLCHAEIGRALALALSGKAAEAGELLPQPPEKCPARLAREIDLGHILVQACLGNHISSIAEAIKYARDTTHLSGRTLFDLACAHALCASAVARDRKLSELEGRKLAEFLAVQAVAYLRAAQAAQYFQTDAAVKRFTNNRCLDSVRSRQDFQKLLRVLRPGQQVHGV